MWQREALPTETLLQALARLADPRARNRSHPLPAILALCVCAMLCGCRSLLAIQEWGRSHGASMAEALGFRRDKTPCVATLSKVLRRVSAAQLEAVLAAWFGQFTPVSKLVAGWRLLALDGKTLRGAQGHGELPAVALVAAFALEQGIVVDEEAVADSDELGAVRRLLERLPLDGVLVTGDALQTQRDVSQMIVEKGGPTFSRPKTTSPRSSTRSTGRSKTNPPRARPARPAATATGAKSAPSKSPTPRT